MSDFSPSPPPPPPPPVAAPTAPATQFDFVKPFAYVFEDPRWLQKVLIGGLFYLAAFLIVGIFFVLGYMARTARNVAAGEATPLPEWEDIGSFLGDGLRMFVVVAAYIVPFVVIAVSFAIPAGILGAFENEGIQALGSGLAGCIACLMVPISLFLMFFLPGSLLFTAMEQRIGAGFEFGRIWEFIRGNFANYLLAVVVYLIARFIGGLGIALLCIGVIFTAFWGLLITAHAFGQTWRYSRGA